MANIFSCKFLSTDEKLDSIKGKMKSFSIRITDNSSELKANVEVN